MFNKNIYKLLKVKLIDISPNLKVYSFRVGVRVFLSEFFFCGHFLGRVRVFLSGFFFSWTLSWPSACFLDRVLFFVDACVFA